MATKKKTVKDENMHESDWKLTSGTAKDVEASDATPSSQFEIFDEAEIKTAHTEAQLKDTVLEGETVYDADLVEDSSYPNEVTISLDGNKIPTSIGGSAFGVIDIPVSVSAKSPYTPAFTYNCLASIEGYNGFGVNYRKHWEIEMAIKTLHDLGGAHPNANILGVGAGSERTIFELANAQSAALVTATDIYNDAGDWDNWHGKKFLENPHAYAPAGLPYDRNRVAAMHVDMCDMPYDDEVYDGIFSSGSIEHVGNPKKTPNWEQVAKAAKEIGRVLKVGGIASISTEFKVAGEGWGFEGVRLFTVDDIMKYIVEPSGLEMVGDIDFEYHGDLADAVSQPDVVRELVSEENKPLLSFGHFLFTSIHLALRKSK